MNNDKILVLSYMKLRQLIGLLGILLPFVCVIGGMMFGGTPIQMSISAYYYTNMRDIFVGLMICTATFLFTYVGYDWRDRAIAAGMCISGFILAVCPCLDPKIAISGIFLLRAEISNVIHSACAITFFGLMSANCLFIFTKSNSNNKNMTKEKKIRNLTYIICGLAIPLSAILLLILNNYYKYSTIIFETIMLLAFGIAWLTKGQAIAKDLTK